MMSGETGDHGRFSEAPWPEAGLETVGACPMCGESDSSVRHNDLVDSVYKNAPGVWSFRRCNKCGSGYLNPRPNKHSIHRAYEGYYTHVDDDTKAPFETLNSLRRIRRKIVNGYLSWRFGSNAFPAWRVFGPAVRLIWPLRSQLDREYRHLPRRHGEGGLLLDIGSGNGSFLRVAESCGWAAYGVDPDPKAVAESRKRGLRVECGGIEVAKALGLRFDVITMSHVLEHVHDPVDTLRRCHELLKPNGFLWLELPRMDSAGHERFGRDWRGLECPRHLVLPSQPALVQTLSLLGFTGIKELPRPSAVRPMFFASRAMASGLSPFAASKVSALDHFTDTIFILLEKLRFKRKELITLGCRAASAPDGRAEPLERRSA